ncbi:HugZ family protein [Pelistega europaea]|uniref:Pyridoxamine 5'-phosphate oxidase n=1 Tax=Pelistega europaea TaxID=106147 RepID=A0A7Y4P737_9BURK|nr:pyridoxamine 5'-phosphate oxidase family protein [Pelistega europaea]NOL50549.1 pyridoxamine 5'-phosphate oxidase [Pelistega europaea]
MAQSINLNEIRQQALQFPSHFQSVQLATCCKDGIPEASYACYLFKDGKYYLYLSRLAAHFNNLATNPHCSLLFIEDEDKAKQIFARQRLTIQCSVSIILRGSDVFNRTMDDFAERFGSFMKAVRDLTDFELFELSPEHGSYVAGFAQTYRLSGTDFTNITPVLPASERQD